MPTAIARALREANVSMADIDGVAFTRGPGMAGCLAVAANAGRGIAAATNKPIVGVHHMQAHALTSLLTESDPPKFPFLTLLVSGGHTLLLLAYSPTRFKILATTVDSAIGQAIDSVARLLKLSWHDENGTLIGAGAALERLAASSPPAGVPIPTIKPFPVAFPNLLSFSFAGPKGEVNRMLGKLPPDAVEKDEGLRIAIARGFQEAAVAQLEEKVKLALRWCDKRGVKVNGLVASGGVASNMYLRERLTLALQENPEDPIPLICPPPHLCTDNAVMVGWASISRFLAKDHDPFDIDLKPTWSLEDLSSEDITPSGTPSI
ncbi:hypothetical protein FRC04_004368 [Tulasnella sp. 424]|nr:hypothetical protein FRC04_004368 [Tulasnella sp. 424]